jgi:hypothetical protein
MFYRPLVFLLSLALFIGGAASAAWATTVDKTPDRTITVIPSPSPSSVVSGVAVAQDGRTYVTRYDPFGVTATVVYRIDASGTESPISTIPSSSSGNFPSSVVVGSDNRLYVVNSNLGIYVLDLNGNQLGLIPRSAPGQTPVASGLNFPQDVGVDSSGKIYVTDSGTSKVSIFPAGTVSDVAPLKTITVGSSVKGIKVFPDGTFWIAIDDQNNNPDSVQNWSSTGNGALIKTISGANTGLNAPVDVDISHAGLITVSHNPNSAGAISFFAANASGNVAPQEVWAGQNTGLSAAQFISFGTCGDLFVATGASSLIQIFGTCPPGPSPSVSPTQATLPSTSAVEVNSTQLWLGIGIALSGVLLGWLSLGLKRKASK